MRTERQSKCHDRPGESLCNRGQSAGGVHMPEAEVRAAWPLPGMQKLPSEQQASETTLLRTPAEPAGEDLWERETDSEVTFGFVADCNLLRGAQPFLEALLYERPLRRDN
jgi:hypothetical protein